MRDVANYIESGILQVYVLGLASAEEKQEVESFMILHPEIRDAIELFSRDIEHQAVMNATQPPVAVKTTVLATFDYMERLMKGEQPSFPPPLTNESKVDDYAPWLERKDIHIAGNFEGMYAKIIGYSPEMTTAIVWMHEMSTEMHQHEIEKFLVVEGSCDVTIGAHVYHLSVGDVMSIPLGFVHHAISTSATPCKIILQRIAA
jgi:mannose-6-phosphate isomerase-like protein (cupin superfamily)